MVPVASARTLGRGQHVESTTSNQRKCNGMTLLRIPPIAALGAAAALAIGVPAAGAQIPAPVAGLGTTPVGTLGGPAVGGGVATAGCGPAVGADLQGRTGGSDITVCGSGPTFIAPDVGPIATVIGPTIITPAFVGNTVIVSAGNVALGVGG
jgi:hypothetical protein